ncbi:MAG: formate/nitrite transporter family protein [Lachnospiraceae bacterium]|nr:formate/nitrite transporter family protein [Lachnospiraceae bacterium]MDY5742372.1 formate/nitrite transporter family protein [Lachnospiraceae bacterium]
MYNEMLDAVNYAAKKKLAVLGDRYWKYLLSSAFAGSYIGIGMILIFTIGGYMAGSPAVKTIMGLSFAVALCLVIFTKTDLFTGNTFVMTIGWLSKTVRLIDLVKIWLTSYCGNFIGAMLLSLIFVGSGLVNGTHTMEYFGLMAFAKANGTFFEILCRGILCNVMVCLAMMITYRTKDEVAKILMTFMCLFVFITSGFEHSIANMTVYGVSLMAGIDGVTVGHALHNIIPATIGNIIGGGLIIGGGSYLLKSSDYRPNPENHS